MNFPQTLFGGRESRNGEEASALGSTWDWLALALPSAKASPFAP